MSKQPKTLRLADWLESTKLPYDPADVTEAAAELRRLHDVEQQKSAMAEGLAEGAKDLRKANDEIDRLYALNAELLEALKEAQSIVRFGQNLEKLDRMLNSAIAKAEAK